ncbi:cell adhesion molecule Dscam1-like [Periplaneta americana]|uniref:cell adhesion molecule Dscam1-like n=1 Tax=Periplaneta americana TaxID=6978 RepID=UPI0037E87E52
MVIDPDRLLNGLFISNVCGKFIQDDPRVRVNSEGTLIISSVQSSDAGNYTCTAENKHNKDEIMYSLTVKVPSTPYLFSVASSTTSSITLQWKPGQSLGNTIQGYHLNYKREFGEWEKIKLSSDKFNYTLGGLQCGTKYQFFLRAFNQLGMSNPTDILPTRTQGSAPIVPDDTELIRVNSTSISLDLGSWQDGGCPITSLVVEYKLKLESQWTLVSNNIKFEQVEFLVLDLNPETWYTLRMTAHNSAGSSVTQFDFVTLTSSGATVAPDLIVNSSYGEGRFYSDPGIIIPLVAGIMILIVASVGLYFYIKKKKETFPPNNFGEKSGRADVTSETALMNVEKKSCVANSSGSTSGVGVSLDGEPISPRETSYLPTPMRVSLGRREDISPYATFRLPMAGGEGSGVAVGAVPDPTDTELSSSLSHRQYIHHAQHCEKLQQLPATYGSCGDSIYTKIHKKSQYQNEGSDWIPLHSLYQAHRY